MPITREFIIMSPAPCAAAIASVASAIATSSRRGFVRIVGARAGARAVSSSSPTANAALTPRCGRWNLPEKPYPHNAGFHLHFGKGQQPPGQGVARDNPGNKSERKPDHRLQLADAALP